MSLHDSQIDRFTKAADQLEIVELLSGYCHAIDAGKWDSLDGIFTEDAEFIYVRVVSDEREVASQRQGIGPIKLWLEETLRSVTTMHYMTNHMFTSIDLARATTRSYLLVMKLALDGIYECEHVRTEHGWRIHRLTLEQHVDG